MLTLKFTKRNKGEDKQDELKAVYYGGKSGNESISIKPIEFEKVYREVGQSGVINLEGEGKKLQALIHEVQYAPVRYTPIHVDFYVVEKGEKINLGNPRKTGQTRPLRSYRSLRRCCGCGCCHSRRRPF